MKVMGVDGKFMVIIGMFINTMFMVVIASIDGIFVHNQVCLLKPIDRSLLELKKDYKVYLHTYSLIEISAYGYLFGIF